MLNMDLIFYFEIIFFFDFSLFVVDRIWVFKFNMVLFLLLDSLFIVNLEMIYYLSSFYVEVVLVIFSVVFIVVDDDIEFLNLI